jgi:hypothetical protein
MEIAMKENECGACQECCVLFAIDEAGTKTGERCQHQCAAGCAIHGNHPKVCKEYKCLYRQGAFQGEMYRPDNLGIIFDPRSNPLRLNMFECKPGALDSERTRYIKNKVKKSFSVPLQIFPYGSMCGTTEAEERLTHDQFDYNGLGEYRLAKRIPLPLSA